MTAPDAVPGGGTPEPNSELQDMMRRAQRVNWISDRVLEGKGNLEFCLTEDGRIGVFMRQENQCRGIGATAGEAIDNAIHRMAGGDHRPASVPSRDAGGADRPKCVCASQYADECYRIRYPHDNLSDDTCTCSCHEDAEEARD